MSQLPSNFTPNPEGNRTCSDGSHFGQKSARYDYIMKGLTGDTDYPSDACSPYYYGNAQIDNLQVNGTATGSFQGSFNGTINVQSWKGFDIKHPTRKNHRLRHICLEGPEAGVYYRGRLTNSNIIELPEYWIGLVDSESITVTLTQIGYSQDLIVEKIEWGRRIIVKSGTGSNIDCYFVINGARIDGEKLIVEYEGETPSDYPGDPSQYSISGYDYGRGCLTDTPDHDMIIQ
jgi:hypothetical protein